MKTFLNVLAGLLVVAGVLWVGYGVAVGYGGSVNEAKRGTEILSRAIPVSLILVLVAALFAGFATKLRH
jgi:hypothetical protein